MKAIDLKKKYLKKKMLNKVGVIAIKKETWWHVHDNERIPKNGETIALHPRELLKKGK